MRVAIFGATGATGRVLTDGASARGHRVTAHARTPAKVAHPVVAVVEGDVTDGDSVRRAVAGQEAVLCVLGAATPRRRDPSLVEGVSNIVLAMEQAGVSRLVYLSFMGVEESRPRLSWLGRTIVAPVLLRNVVRDHEEKERLITGSRLAWTIVRPPRLTNGPATGYRSGEGIRATTPVPRVSRADVASFMLDQLESDAYVHAKPSVMEL